MALTLEQLIKTAQQHQDDDWRAYNRMESLASGEPDGELQRLLWQGQREGKLNLGGMQSCWWDLGQHPDHFDAGDFIKLLDSIAKTYAKKPAWNNTPWSDSDTPGWPYNFHNIFDRKEKDQAFYKELATKWDSLPYPYDTALGFRLAARGALPVDALPESMLIEYATLYVKFSQGYGVWENIPWPTEVWHGAIAQVIQDPAVEVIKDFSSLADLLPSAPPELIARGIRKLTSTTDDKLPPCEQVAAHAEVLIDALEASLLELKGETPQPVDWNGPAPFFHAVNTYLAACERLGRAPAEECDSIFAAFIQHYKPSWSGGYFERYHARMHELLGVIPAARLEPMLTGSKRTPFLLIGALPNEAVAARAVAGVVSPAEEDLGYDFERHARMGLDALGEVAIKPIVEALASGGGKYRSMLVSTLANFPHNPESIKGLASCLGDKAKGIREAAVHSLPLGDADLVMDAIEEHLGARTKPAREASAQILLALAPSQRRYELAQARLEKEKTKDVVALLERVEAPDSEAADVAANLSVDGAVREEAIEAIKQDPAAWVNYKHLDEGILPILFDLWAADADESSVGFYHSASYDSLGKSWIEALEHLGEECQPGLDYALMLAAAMGDYRYEEYFTLIDEIYGAEAVGARLGDMLEQNRFIRPANFKRCTYLHPAKDGASLLMTRYPKSAATSVLELLQDKRKGTRDEAKSFILANKELYEVSQLTPLLGSNRKDVRLASAELLGEFGERDALDALEARAKKEKTSDVKEAIARAIVQISNLSFDPSDFATDRKGDLALDAALGKMPTVPLPYAITGGVKSLSAPRWVYADEAMNEAALGWLLSELARESMEHHGEALCAVCERLDKKDLHVLCEELIKANGGDGKSGWALFMQGVIASPKRIEETGRHLEEFAQSQSWGWGDHGVEVMVRRGTPQCVRILDDWHHKTRRDALKWRSKSGIARIAQAKGITVDEALEMSISDFGFDKYGEQRFDYGSRTILVKLEPGDDFSYKDEDADRSYKSMPSAKSGDNDLLVSEARSQVSQIKKELKRLRRNQSRRLENAMGTQRRWVPSSWRERYALQPVMRSFAQGMVWGLFDAKTDELLVSVHVDSSGDVVDLEDETHALDDEKHRLGVVHPAQMSAEDRERWIACFVDYEIIQSFEQLMRDVHAREDWPDQSKAIITRFGATNPGRFMGKLDKLGWEKGPREDAGMINYSTRQYGPWYVTLSHDGFSPEYYEDTLYLQDFDIRKGEERVAPKDLPAHIFSELIHELGVLAGGIEEDA